VPRSQIEDPNTSTAPVFAFADASELLTKVICGTGEERHKPQPSAAPSEELNRFESHAVMMSLASPRVTYQIWKSLNPDEAIGCRKSASSEGKTTGGHRVG